MKQYNALSVVKPAGELIRQGRKIIEVRKWLPDSLPLRNLAIVENEFILSREGIAEDPNGRVVALVDVESVGDWQKTEFSGSRASYWEEGWTSWKLSNIRPISEAIKAPAKLRIYTIEVPI